MRFIDGFWLWFLALICRICVLLWLQCHASKMKQNELTLYVNGTNSPHLANRIRVIYVKRIENEPISLTIITPAKDS